MPAPKGHAPYNKNGEGGCPKKWDRDRMADDIIDWVHHEDSIDIKQWRIKHMIARNKVLDMCNDSERFKNAYAYAFDVLALRRFEMNHTDEMKDSLYGMHSRVYDKDLDEQKKAEKKFELECKKLAEEQMKTPMEINVKFDAMMAQLSSLQKERKIADNNIKEET